MSDTLLSLIANPLVVSPHGSYRAGVKEKEERNLLKDKTAYEKAKLKSFERGEQDKEKERTRLETLALSKEGTPEYAEAFKAVATYDPGGALNYVNATKGLSNEQIKKGFMHISLAKPYIADDEVWNNHLDQAKAAIGGNDKSLFVIESLRSLPVNERAAAIDELEGVARSTGLYTKAGAPGSVSDGTGQYSKGTEIVSKDTEGNLQVALPVFNKKTGEWSLTAKPIPASELVSRAYGESAEDYEQRVIREAKGKEKAILQEQLIGQPKIASAVDASKAAIKLSNEMIPRIDTARNNVTLYKDAIAAIDDGAQTGLIQNMLPPLLNTTRELRNIRGRLGLSVIQSTTFGSLSEAELKFALDTSIPPKDEKELRAWLVKKARTQEASAQLFEDAAIYLGSGKTIAEWVQRNKDIRKADDSAVNEKDPLGLF